MLAPCLERHHGARANARAALAFFLDYYAFERQGRSPDYSPAAVDAVYASAGLDPSEIWSRYERLLGGRKLNRANNPLCPRGTPFERGKTSHQTWQPSAVEFIRTDQSPRNMLLWARDELVVDRTAETHRALCSINGIGTKIASFFLRDVAESSGIAVSLDRHLLQPVDVWVYRLAELTCGGPRQRTGEECARAIVEKSLAEDVSPERVNQGMWYFATQVCGSSEYVVKRTIRDGAVWEAIEDHVAGIRDSADRTAEAWERLQCR